MERLRFEECKNCKDWNGNITKCFNVCGKPLDAMEEFNKYKNLEEQGKLLKLPCAVGDTVYTINTLPSRKTVIGETTADAFMCALSMLEGRFGKTIFLTFEEAEAALKEMSE